MMHFGHLYINFSKTGSVFVNPQFSEASQDQHCDSKNALLAGNQRIRKMWLGKSQGIPKKLWNSSGL